MVGSDLLAINQKTVGYIYILFACVIRKLIIVTYRSKKRPISGQHLDYSNDTIDVLCCDSRGLNILKPSNL